MANFTRNRILMPGCEGKPLYCCWYPRASGGHNAESCGTAVLGVRPKERSILLCGDFDAPVPDGRMREGRRTAWYSDGPMTIDRQFFMTKGQSVRLELPGGNRLLRQTLDKNLLQPGMRYRLSFYLKLENVVNRKSPRSGFTSDIRFGKKGMGNALYPLKPSLLGSMEWTRYQFDFTAPEGIGSEHSPFLGFYLSKEAEGKVWIDHVEIVPVENAGK